MTKYLIVGNGVAGTTAAEYIRKQDGRGKISIVTDEDLPFYFRPRLIEYIGGETSEQKLIAKNEQWYQDHNIDLILKTRVIDADPENRVVITENNRRISYDRLLVATGSHSFIPPINGSEKAGVFTLRNIHDARRILEYSNNIDYVVVIGGGLLGLEAGNALRKAGKKVLVVEFFSRLLPRQLDADGAKKLRVIMERMGFSFRLGVRTEKIKGDGRVSAVVLEGGETLQANMVLISAGVRPNPELSEALKLDYEKGIKVDEHLRTNRPDIFAAGDVTEFKGTLYGIWPAAMEQGKAAGVNMAGGDMIYEGSTMANTLKVAGVDLASAGNIDAENKFESKVVTDENVYKKIVIENDQIIGCIMLGDKEGFNKITQAISEKKNVFQIKDQILSEGFDFNSL